MRVGRVAVVMAMVARGAVAQTAVAPAPPPAAPPTPAPAAPGGDAASPARPLPTPTPAPPAASWQARQTAVLQVLDKVDGRSGTFAVAVGSAQVFRNLTVAVRACFARPSDQPEDATALLLVTEPGSAAPVFSGWMLAAEPTAAMLQDPVYDLRVLGCH